MAKVGPRKRRERQDTPERIRRSQSREMRVRAILTPVLAFGAVSIGLLALWTFA